MAGTALVANTAGAGVAENHKVLRWPALPGRKALAVSDQDGL